VSCFVVDVAVFDRRHDVHQLKQGLRKQGRVAQSFKKIRPGGAGGGLLIGVDRVKPKAVLEPAYDDALNDLLVAFAKSWGLFYLILLAAGVMIYALWPGNRSERFLLVWAGGPATCWRPRDTMRLWLGWLAPLCPKPAPSISHHV